MPCDYNQILLPDILDPLKFLAEDFTVYTNGTAATEDFSLYEDDVSKYCTPPASYLD